MSVWDRVLGLQARRDRYEIRAISDASITNVRWGIKRLIRYKSAVLPGFLAEASLLRLLAAPFALALVEARTHGPE